MSHEKIPLELRERFRWLNRIASGRPSRARLAEDERQMVLSTLRHIVEHFAMIGDSVSREHFLQEYGRYRELEPFTVSELRRFLSIAISYGIGRPERDYGERRLERRIMGLEHELSRLRSNPALEKKVAKLEKELQKIRVASVVNLEGNEKEQKDMLKNYKESEKRVFVIMPFAPIYDDVWKGGIERACNSEEFGYLRVDKISLSSWITEDIVNYIEMADFVITDISGNNPNVMFELGWALAKDKKPIVIRQQDDPAKVPFDVKDIRYISYINSWSGIERLYRDICKFLKTTSEIVDKEATKKKTRQKKSTKTKEN